ncbi:MAG: hypothetical protein ACLSE8_11320 [Parasutterella sp.]
MKILVPIDGSEFSKHSIEFVTSRATLLGHNPEIELLSVQAPVPARASKINRQWLPERLLRRGSQRHS